MLNEIEFTRNSSTAVFKKRCRLNRLTTSKVEEACTRASPSVAPASEGISRADLSRRSALRHDNCLLSSESHATGCTLLVRRVGRTSRVDLVGSRIYLVFVRGIIPASKILQVDWDRQFFHFIRPQHTSLKTN